MQIEQRFLVVEDQEFQRRTLVQMLDRLGATRVYEAADGQAALDVLGELDQPVDVIVSDLDMPGMDGMEFIRHVGRGSVPVSVILASALERSLIAAVETMTTAYGVKLLGVIEKPVTPQKLEAALEPPKPVPTTSSLKEVRRPLSLEEMSSARAPQRVFTLDEIARGLRDNQFEPFFQPKMELATGRIVGVEALARWRHPEMGKVEPEAFVKPLEASGQIDNLTWTMLRKSAACCKAWRSEGVGCHVAVKLAVGALADEGLADRVTELVFGQDLDPREMLLEVTGAAAATRAGNALENLARLRMRGFGLSINDSGGGHLSMQQLTRIAFTELKVDQAFAKDASAQESSRVPLLSILATARTLGIASVVEGVETQLDWDLLVELGFDVAQGFFVAPPMDYIAFVDWVRGRNQ